MLTAAALHQRLELATAAGEPTLLRLTGTGAVALARTLTEVEGFQQTVTLGELGEHPIAWLHDHPGSRIQADLWVADLRTRTRPGVVLLTGQATQGGHPELVPTIEVDGSSPDATGATRVLLPDALDADGVIAAYDRGDLTTAHALWELLERPDRERLRWLELARLNLTGRSAEVRAAAYRRTPGDDVPALLLQVALADYKGCHYQALRNGMEGLLAHARPALAQDARFLYNRFRKGPLLPRRFWPATSWLRWEHQLAMLAHGEDPGPLPDNRFTRALLAFTRTPEPIDVQTMLSLGHLDDAASLARQRGADARVVRTYTDLYWSRRKAVISGALERGRTAFAADVLASIPHQGIEYRRMLEIAALTIAAQQGHTARVVQLLEEDVHQRTRVRELADLERRTRDATLACRVPILGMLVQGGSDTQQEQAQAALTSLPTRPIALGPYLLDEVLGEGGMGTVWAGRHADLGLRVAVKLLRADDVDARWLEAFEREVEISTRLDHAAIVQTLDFGRAGAGTAAQSNGAVKQGQPYLVMERVDGGTLFTRARGASFAAHRAWIRQLLEALAYAHARGLVHRDVKPENALIGLDGRLRLADFGLAALDADELAGTPAFMAPELLRGGGQPTVQTDLYAVGCTFWNLVTGLTPYLGSPAMLARAHVRAPLPRLEPLAPVPSGLEALLHRWLAKEPSRRPGSAAEAIAMLDALGTATEGASRTAPAAATEQQTFDLDGLVEHAPVQGAPAPAPVEPTSRDTPGAHDPGPRLEWQPRQPAFHARPPTANLLQRGDPLPVGNREARRALFDLLAEAREQRQPVRVALEGPEGLGQASLIEHTLRAAREQGVWVDGSLLQLHEGTEEPTHRIELHPLSVAQLCTVARSRVPVSVSVAVRAAARAAGRPAVAMRLLEGWRVHPGFVPGPIGLELRSGDDPATGPARRWWMERIARLPRARLDPVLLAGALFDGFDQPTFARVAAHLGIDEALPTRWMAVRHVGHGLPPELQAALRGHRHRIAALHEAAGQVEHGGEQGALRRSVHQAWHTGDTTALRDHLIRHVLAADRISLHLIDGANEVLDRHLDPDPDLRRWLAVARAEHLLQRGELGKARRVIRSASATTDPRLAAIARGTYSMAVWSDRGVQPFRDDEIRGLLAAIEAPGERARVARTFLAYCSTRFPALHQELLANLVVWAPDDGEVHGYHAIRTGEEQPLRDVLERFGPALSKRYQARLLDHLAHYALERHDPTTALRCATEALQADESDRFARLNRAIALALLDRQDEARRAARDAALHANLIDLGSGAMLAQLLLLGLSWSWPDAWWNDLASVTVHPDLADSVLRGDPTVRLVLDKLVEAIPESERKDRFARLVGIR